MAQIPIPTQSIDFLPVVWQSFDWKRPILTVGWGVSGIPLYLLTTAAEDETETPKRAETGLTGWIDCYPKSRLAGTLFCGGVNDPREIEGNPKLQEAFELGMSIG